MSSQSFIAIDTFTLYDLFMFTPGKPLTSASALRDYTGGLHLNTR